MPLNFSPGTADAFKGQRTSNLSEIFDNIVQCTYCTECAMITVFRTLYLKVHTAFVARNWAIKNGHQYFVVFHIMVGALPKVEYNCPHKYPQKCVVFLLIYKNQSHVTFLNQNLSRKLTRPKVIVALSDV